MLVRLIRKSFYDMTLKRSVMIDAYKDWTGFSLRPTSDSAGILSELRLAKIQGEKRTVLHNDTVDCSMKRTACETKPQR